MNRRDWEANSMLYDAQYSEPEEMRGAMRAAMEMLSHGRETRQLVLCASLERKPQ